MRKVFFSFRSPSWQIYLFSVYTSHFYHNTVRPEMMPKEIVLLKMMNVYFWTVK